MRDNIAREIAAQGGTVAELRPDLSPALAERLGITDPGQLLSETGIAHLLNGRRLDGGEIAGKEVHKPRLSIAEIFGLDPRVPVSGKAMRNVLAGKRADGDVPKAANGRALEEKVVDGASKRFRAAMGVPAHREATPDEVAHLVAGRTATGGMVDANDYRRQIHATRPPVGFVDLTFSADKSLSVAWALAPTEAERADAAGHPPARRRRCDGACRAAHRLCPKGRGREGWRRTRPAGLDLVPTLHGTAGGRHRADRQRGPRLYRPARGAVADGRPAAAHPLHGLQCGADRQRPARIDRPGPAGWLREGRRRRLSGRRRDPRPSRRHRGGARQHDRRGTAGRSSGRPCATCSASARARR